MKKLLVIGLLALGGWVGYQSYRAGQLSIFPRKSSPEEIRLAELEEELHAERARLQQAGRASGLTGVDTTYAADAARRRIQQLEQEIAQLRKRLGEG